MASRGYEPLPDDDYDYETPGPYDDDDDNANQTFSFGPPHSSTPVAYKEEIEMKTIQEEKSGLPETSYGETSFGGTEDLEKRLADLRRDAITGLLNTTKIPNVDNPLSYEERKKEIQRVRDFIKKRYPNAIFQNW